MMKNLRLILVIVLLLCLAPMPYGYYMLVRFFAMVMFGVMAYQYYLEKKKSLMLVFGKHSKKCTFYTLRFGCSFAAVNTIKPQLL